MSQSCRFCKEEIKEGAVLCVHCSMAQGFSRHLRFGNTTLALLVALIAVTGSLSPLLKSTFFSPAPDLKATLVTSDKDGFFAILGNEGDAHGSIISATMGYRTDPFPDPADSSYYCSSCESASFSINLEEGFLSPREVRLVRFTLNSAGTSFGGDPESRDDTSIYNLRIRINSNYSWLDPELSHPYLLQDFWYENHLSPQFLTDNDGNPIRY